MNKIEWGIVVDGELRYAPPEIYEEDGKVKELKSHDDFVNAGYKKIIKRKPSYNPYLQYLVLDEIIDLENIYIYYNVVDMHNNKTSLTYEQMTSIIEEEVENNG